MSTSSLQDIAIYYFNQLLNARDLSVCDRLLAADYIDHDAPPDTPPGPASIKQYVAQFLADYPDLRVEIEETLSAGNKVVLRILWHGKHKDTCDNLCMRGIVILTFNPGCQICERWSAYTTL